MTDARLTKFVMDYRRGLLGRKRSDGMCYAVCAPLASLLQFRGVEVHLRQSWIKYEVGTGNHYWLELEDGRVIHPTADQFNKRLGKNFPKVYIGRPDDRIHASGQ